MFLNEVQFLSTFNLELFDSYLLYDLEISPSICKNYGTANFINAYIMFNFFL